MRDVPREPRELPSQMRSKAPHTIFFFQLKHAGNSTQLANLAGRCRRQTSSEAISIQKGPRTEGPDIRFIASSARKEGHLMCLRLAQDCRAGNLISGPSVRGPRRTSYSVMFGSASTSNGEISPRSNLRRATSAIMAALSVQADKGGTVTRIP